jgi:zinc finger CCHC domain-containing protein 9
MVDIEQLASQYFDGKLSGLELSQMVDRNELTKSERRKVVKTSEKLKKKQSTESTELTARQKLRLQVKEKKSLPKLSKEERRKKFQKDLDSEREKESANFTICLGCKKRGHFVKNCPKLDMCLPAVVESSDEGVCFNCGSREHTLKNCDKERKSSNSKNSKYDKSNGSTLLPYAVCFICKQVGHIARDCPENANGLYPKGGCCHICLQKDHLVKDCPERTEEDKLRFGFPHLNE